jgi:hypothetical protein
VLDIGVSAKISCRQLRVSPSNSFDEWNWFECVPDRPRKHSLTLQLKLSPVLSASALCTSALQNLNRGNGSAKSDVSMIHNSHRFSSRLMIITGTLTLITAVLFLRVSRTSRDFIVRSRIGSFLFPDSPTNAWFLTPDERVKAVQRIKVRCISPQSRSESSMNYEGKPNGS